jgi:hypothetical protein
MGVEVPFPFCCGVDVAVPVEGESESVGVDVDVGVVVEEEEVLISRNFLKGFLRKDIVGTISSSLLRNVELKN